jgi:hypothetical protein
MKILEKSSGNTQNGRRVHIFSDIEKDSIIYLRLITQGVLAIPFTVQKWIHKRINIVISTTKWLKIERFK